MPELQLVSAIHAVQSLIVADAFPVPVPLSRERLRKSGAMQPWLRLALGNDAADLLEAAGQGAWCVDALLGHATTSLPVPVMCDPEEVGPLKLLEGLAGESSLSGLRSWLSHQPEPGCGMLAVVDAVANGTSSYAEVARRIVDYLADRHGIALADDPADVSAWRTETLATTIVDVQRGRVSSTHDTVLVQAADGRKWWLGANDVVRYPRNDAIGTELVLEIHGVTRGHGGYVFRTRLLADIRLDEDVRAVLAEASRRAAELQECMSDHATTDSGQQLGAGDPVVLLCDCLEASRGTRGQVEEILGNMAVVRFDGVSEPVPCYGHALELA